MNSRDANTLYLPERYGLPSILAFVTVGILAYVFSFWNNNHTPCLDCAKLTNERPAFETFAKAQFPKCMHGLLIAAARQARGDALPTMPMRWNHRR